ncbi:DUF5691 domain-containing protein [Roseibacillus ishigakijimensis]|uniref:Uncharacterized protein n=1 Tax=Roseibacillus ishigakijimensis TaxID=454146 RepID=A0A934RPM1_9BACT|nr:DUF5691 domain-containing protein [Roseibacillus ishigakijimensis]MBK1833517.1 hypothetical protein [Roseibacillus ishigakijimensis]
MKSSLLTLALLGTNRQAQLPPAPHELLDSSWEKLSTLPDPAAALLQAAALENLLRLSGQKPLPATDSPAPAADEVLPYLSEPAVAPALRMLDGDHSDLLPEYLRLVASHNQLLPPRLLPALFNHCRRHSILIPLAIATSGNRGQWLAAQNEHWKIFLNSYSPEPLSDDIWETGTHNQRAAWLRQTLAAEPEKAASAILASWPSDSPDDRELFTKLTTNHPHCAHLTWLEDLALPDRRQATRNFARQALLRIPESNYSQRSLARLQSVLTRKGSTLTASPPQAFDPTWSEDGIKEKPPKSQGEKDFWLSQIIAAYPLSHWIDAQGLTTKIFSKLKLDPDWSSTILTAWLQNLQNFPAEPDLSLAVYSFFAPGGLFKKSQLGATLDRKVLLDSRHWPDDPALQGRILELLPLEPSEKLSLLASRSIPIDPVTQPKLAKLIEWFITQKNPPLHRGQASALAISPHPSSIPLLLQKISQLNDLPSVIEEFALTLEFRQSYLQHFPNRH